jgi:hypothetical protein
MNGDIKELLELLRSQGVHKFKNDKVEIEFHVVAYLKNPITDNTIQEKLTPSASGENDQDIMFWSTQFAGGGKSK